MGYWRRAAGRSKLERVRNEKIREIMGVEQTIVEEVRVKQLKYHGHVQRMAPERLTKQILDWVPAGKRRRGRPRNSWREGINKEMQERGLEENQWIGRAEWRLEVSEDFGASCKSRYYYYYLNWGRFARSILFT
ncbi:uncharacterized protein LOC123673448 [Harmonia axyridis]|uniref:uncharacterized protein LOC123673448 n=1 Tax=Harmonia axyridis TaxID=115357 RepID=UPI001E278465|nr:uncharacterized protein LOC123673448 [Harmonia axyridis]